MVLALPLQKLKLFQTKLRYLPLTLTGGTLHLLVTYTLYTLLPGALLALEVPESRAGEPGMIWTIPFVAYGVLRYLYLVYRQEQGERPEKLLTGDLPLFVSVAGYGAVVAWVVYL